MRLNEHFTIPFTHLQISSYNKYSVLAHNQIDIVTGNLNCCVGYITTTVFIKTRETKNKTKEFQYLSIYFIFNLISIDHICSSFEQS